MTVVPLIIREIGGKRSEHTEHCRPTSADTTEIQRSPLQVESDQSKEGMTGLVMVHPA